MQLTIIIVIALLTIVPSTAAAVTVTYTSIVDAKTGAYAQVSDHGQLNVRGAVTTSDIVPTSSWSNAARINDTDGVVAGDRYLVGAPEGQGITVGALHAYGAGDDPNGPFVALIVRYVAAGNACFTTLGVDIIERVASDVLWSGMAQRSGDRSVSFTFPIPLTVEPKAGKRACLYGYGAGYTGRFSAMWVEADGTIGTRP